MPRIVILGAGAQGRITADLCRDMGLDVAGFLDDTRPAGTDVNGLPVLGGFSAAWTGSFPDAAFTVALGDPAARSDCFRQIAAAGGALATVVHPRSWVSPSARIGVGVVVSPFCYVKANARVGDFSLLEVGCSVGVDNEIGESVFLGPSCHLNAGVVLGDQVYLGTGTVVIPRRRIGARTIVGAGSTVIHDLPDDVVAAGSPALIIRGRAAPGEASDPPDAGAARSGSR